MMYHVDEDTVGQGWASGLRPMVAHLPTYEQITGAFVSSAS